LVALRLIMFLQIGGDCKTSSDLEINEDFKRIVINYDGVLLIKGSESFVFSNLKIDKEKALKNFKSIFEVLSFDIFVNNKRRIRFSTTIDRFEEGKKIKWDYTIEAKRGDIISFKNTSKFTYKHLDVLSRFIPIDQYVVNHIGSISFSKTSAQGAGSGGILPDISQLDFIKDIMHRYGLLVKLDKKDPKHLIFKNISNLFKEDANKENWSDKFVKVEREDYDIGKYGQNNYMKYKYEEGYVDEKWGNYYYTTRKKNNLEHDFDGNLQSDDKTLIINNTLFESIYTVLNKSAKYFTNHIWLNQVPLYEKTGDNEYKFTKSPFGDESGIAFYNTNNFFLNRLDMNYQHFIDKYYSEFKKVLDRQKRVQIWCKLNALDIHHLDFFRLKFFEQLGRNFYLEKVESYRGGGITKCTFIEMPL